MRHLLLFAAAVCVVTACQPSAPQQSAAERIDELADRYYEWALERTPERAYFAGVDIDVHDGLFDNSPEAQLAAEAVEDELLAAVTAIAEEELLGTPAWITKAFLEQRLRSDEALRVCRQELWSVSQMSGWQLAYAQLAALQPVGTPELREQALTRWSKLAVFIDQEIANLQSGLEQGYSAPQPVVRRVIEQVDGLLALPIEKSPFFSPDELVQDQAFGKDLAIGIAIVIIPAMQRYRNFLAENYLEAALEELSVVANPDGEDCYDE